MLQSSLVFGGSQQVLPIISTVSAGLWGGGGGGGVRGRARARGVSG